MSDSGSKHPFCSFHHHKTQSYAISVCPRLLVSFGSRLRAKTDQQKIEGLDWLPNKFHFHLTSSRFPTLCRCRSSSSGPPSSRRRQGLEIKAVGRRPPSISRVVSSQRRSSRLSIRSWDSQTTNLDTRPPISVPSTPRDPIYLFRHHIMAPSHIIRVPRTDEEGTFVLGEVTPSGSKPLNVKFVATEGEEPYVVKSECPSPSARPSGALPVGRSHVVHALRTCLVSCPRSD